MVFMGKFFCCLRFIKRHGIGFGLRYEAKDQQPMELPMALQQAYQIMEIQLQTLQFSFKVDLVKPTTNSSEP